MFEGLLSNIDLVALSERAVAMSIRVAGALLFLAVAWMVGAWCRRCVRKALTKTHVDETLSIFLANAARWTVLLLAVLAALGMFGIQTTSFAAVIGAAGLAIGLAFQGTLSNIASGIMLLVFRPFTVDDFINAGGVNGRVVEIGLFTTTFDTLDNRRIFVPNSLIFGGTIENDTYHDVRRVDVAVGTDYGADLDEVRAVLERAIGNVDGVLEDPEPFVYLLQLGGSSIDWSVRAWCSTEAYWEPREALTRAVKIELDKAGIGIPCPQMDVHLDGRLLRD